MNFVALRMLTGDRAKYFGLVFAIAFCTFLLENQTSIFANILRRTASQILDVTDAEVWVMDPKTEYWEQTKALKDTDLTRVRGVSGVQWAVRLFKGNPVAKTMNGKFAVSFLVGLDDATLAGAPRKMLMGSWERLREPDSVIVDKAGYILLFPGEPLRLGRTLEMNDHRVTIVGISDASAPFVSLPVMHARYSEAVNFLGRERTELSFIIARAAPGVSPEELTARIADQTALRARTTQEFMWDCVRYYLKNTGIPVNFGITIAVALVVGTVVAGQTFYLFTVENLKQFGALKAMGVTNPRLIGMILLQAGSVAALGFAVGTGMAATFFEITLHKLATRGIVLMWQCVGLTGAAILFVVIVASLLSIRRVLVLEPAEVFRGVNAMDTSDLAVSCRDVRKHFGEGETRIEALRGVDFSARFGELSFLVGPSGCGKTTLISVIAGLLDRTAGELAVLGARIDDLSGVGRVLFRRQNVGFVFQQYNLLPALTAAENVAVPLLAAGMPRKTAVERGKSLLSRLGLGSRTDALPSTLSGGQQQRVALARALVHEPRLVVCDEPTAALDHANGEAVMQLLAGTAVHPNRAVIVVTHDSRVFHHAHSIAHMDDGRIVDVSRPNDSPGPPGNGATDPNLTEAFA